MSVIGSNILAGASGQGGYFLTNSLRFRSSASAYLNRTPAGAGNRRTFTINFWLKRGELGTLDQLIGQGNGIGGGAFAIYFDSDGLRVYGGSNDILITNAKFRDPASWYMITLAMDTTQATASNRAKLYINGVEQTYSSTTYPTINTDLPFNQAVEHTISGNTSQSYLFDSYMAEFNFIDGQQLTPSSFGETSATTGVWIPKKFSGTYGTNGFYLPFTDNSALTTSSNVGLGKDFSGNANYWTTNNISITSGETYDSMTDVPTLTSATAANYCVLSPIASSPLISLTNGNLTAGGTDEASLIGTIGVNSGKWYWEVTVTSGSVTPYLGVSSNPYDKSGVGSNYLLAGISWYGNAIKKAYTGTASTAAASNTTGVYGFALDISAGTLDYYFNNSLLFTDTTIPTSGVTLFPLNVHTNSGSNSWNPANFNFGQQPFSYTPPTGFNRLNTFNLPTPTIGATASTTANKYMDVSLYSGTTGSNLTVTNSGSMQPDWVWLKARNEPYGHQLYDSVRGVQLRLRSNDTTAEVTNTGGVLSFNSTGFTIGTDAFINETGTTMVGWQWRASNATAVTNTDGTITSTVSANTSAGFSIVAYTGNGTNGATVGHGLGAKPFLIIEKGRTSTFNWSVQGCGELWTPVTSNLFLNGTNALNANGAVAAPTSTVFTPSAVAYANESGVTNIAYCFAPVAGYSAIGTYTGNDSADGTFIYTGFRPAFILYKKITGIDGWVIFDTKRNTYNVVDTGLQPNTSGAEASSAAGSLDILSNGFKQRNANNIANSSSFTYLYMAFAESPFKYANAR
jgi:hypothetical protein